MAITSAMDSTAGAQGAAAAAGSAALAKTSADFNMFLKLLTTQMQNQDPLDPMDTSEYTQQLVQYSQVEQTIQQTSTLKDILARLSTQDMAQASGFIGREVELDLPIAGLSAAPAQWVYEAAHPVASIVATITDANGAVVDTRPIDASAAGRFTWDGKLANGKQAPKGAYGLSLAAVDRSGAKVPVHVTSVGTVQDVTLEDGALLLGIGGIQLPASSLIKVASASSAA